MSRLESGKVSDALAHVERELAALWAPDEGAPKARVCMANLVVLATGRGRDRTVALLDQLESADTARTFLLSVDPMLPPWAIEASVSARCQRDGDRLLCSERIDLTLGAGAFGRASSLITSLAMPEVPTTLVLLEPAPPMLVSSLIRDASRLVIDSEALTLEAASNLADATAAHLIDLAWLRLHPWRNQLAVAFDDPRLRPAVTAIRRLDLATTSTPGAQISPHARLLVGWLASRLGWRLLPGSAVDPLHHAIHIDLSWRLVPDAQPGQLVSVEIAALLGDAHVQIDVAREPHGHTLQTVRTAEGLGAFVENTTLEAPTTAQLVDRAIADVTPDAVLRQALRAAASFAAGPLSPTPDPFAAQSP